MMPKNLRGWIVPHRALETLAAALFVAGTLFFLASPKPEMALAAPLALIGFLVLLRWPAAVYLLILFMVPMDSFRQFGGGHALSISKLLGYGLLGIMVLRAAVDKHVIGLLRTRLWAYLGAFYAIAVLATMASGVPEHSVQALSAFATAYSIFGLTLILASIPAVCRRALPWTVLASLSIGAALALVGYVCRFPGLLMTIKPKGDPTMRAVGVSNDPNIFAAMLAFALPLSAHLFATARSTRGRVLAAVLFLLLLSGVILTYSRGGALIMVIVIVAIVQRAMRRVRPRSLGAVSGAVALAAVVAVLLIPPSYWQRQLSVADVKDESISSRRSYLEVGWGIVRANPVLGIGPDGFRFTYARTHHGMERSQWAPFPSDPGERYAHNTYMEVVAGTGLLGLAAFGAGIALALRNFQIAISLWRLRGDTEMESLARAYRLSFCVVLLGFLVLSVPYLKYFWMCLALSEVLRRQGEEPLQGAAA